MTHTNSAPAGTGLSALDRMVSPELVLVDPELASFARALLPDRPWERFAEPAVRRVALVPAESEPVAEMRVGVAWRPHAGRRGFRLAAAGAGSLAALVALALGLTPSSQRPTFAASAVAPVERAVPATTSKERESARDALPARPTRSAGGTAMQPEPRVFVWAAVPRATGYEIAFYRKTVQILAARTREPRLVIAPEWRFRGERRALTPGSYRWYVWPLQGRGASAVRGKPIVQATVRIIGERRQQPPNG